MILVLIFGLSVLSFTVLLLIGDLRDKSSRFAILIVSLWSLRYLLLIIRNVVDLSEFPWLIFIDQNLFYLDGVFLLWYTKSLGNWQFSLKREVYHFIPFLLSCCITLGKFIWLSKDELNMIYISKILELEKQTVSLSWEQVTIISGIIIHVMIYSNLSLKMIRKYQNSLKQFYSTIGHFQFTWIPKYLLMWLVLIVVPVLIHLLNYLFQIVDILVIDSLLLTLLVFANSYFCYYVVTQNYADTSSLKLAPEKITNQSQRQNLKLVYQKLDECMRSNKPFLKEGLTLSELSEISKLAPGDISNAIKLCGDSNFYNYINGFRVEAIKRELVTSREQIIIIAYKNGFKSKSTFNKVFREFEGCSPSEFRKRQSMN